MLFFTRNSEPFTDFQQNIIQKEFNYIFPKQESEIEEIHFFGEVVTVLSLVPVNIPVQDVFKSALQECNQYGDFIKENCIITNVRVMNLEEIRNFINHPE